MKFLFLHLLAEPELGGDGGGSKPKGRMLVVMCSVP